MPDVWQPFHATCVCAADSGEEIAVGGSHGVLFYTGSKPRLFYFSSSSPALCTVLPVASAPSPSSRAQGALAVTALSWRGDVLAVGHVGGLVSVLHAPRAALADTRLVCRTLPLVPPPAPSVSHLLWHPHEPLLAVAACGDLFLVRVHEGAAQALHGTRGAHLSDVSGLAWSAGAPARLCSSGVDGTVRMWTTDLRAVEQQLMTSAKPICGLALTPLATHLLVGVVVPPNVKNLMYGTRGPQFQLHVVPLLASPPAAPSERIVAADVAWEVRLLSTERAAETAAALRLERPSIRQAQLSALLLQRAAKPIEAHTARRLARALAWEHALGTVSSRVRQLSLPERRSVQQLCIWLGKTAMVALQPNEACCFCRAEVPPSPEATEACCVSGHRQERCVRTGLLLPEQGTLHCALCKVYSLPLVRANEQPFFSELLSVSPGCPFCASPLLPLM